MTKHDLATDIMRTVRFHAFGEPGDVLQLETVAVPDPGPDRILIIVQACGLAPADLRSSTGIPSGF